MTEPSDPLDRLRREPSPLDPPPGAHAAVLRRAARRRVRSAAAVGASVVAVVALVLAVPVLAGPDDGPAPVAMQPSTSATTPPTPTTPGPTSVPGPAPTTPETTPPTDTDSTGPVPAGFAPASVTFTSDLEGYALGQAPCDNPVCTSLVRTSDGGASWVGLDAPLAGPVDGRSGVDQVRYSASGTGWAYGGELWSVEPGRAWTAVPLEDGTAAVDLATDPGSVTVALARCDDAGTCTETVVNTEQGDGLAPAGGADTLPGRAALTRQDGTTWALSVLDGTTTLVRDTGSGAGFTPLPAPCAAGTTDAHLGASSAQQLALVCGSEGAARAFTSGDGGDTWAPSGSFSPAGPVTSVALTPPQALLVASAAGPLLLSPDGGGSVAQTLAGAGFGYVGWTNARQAVAVPAVPAEGVLWLTRDAGSTWEQLVVR